MVDTQVSYDELAAVSARIRAQRPVHWRMVEKLVAEIWRLRAESAISAWPEAVTGVGSEAVVTTD